MKELKTINDDEDYLRKACSRVVFSDPEIMDNIKSLETYCIENNIKALAANQIGISKSIIYLKNTNLQLIKDKNRNEKRILINPRIIIKEGLTKYWETCSSCNDYCCLISRPYKILIQYQDIVGKKHIETFEDYEATVISHCIDHLNGTLIIDIAEEISILPPEYSQELIENHGYMIFETDEEFDTLCLSKEEYKLAR